MTSEDTKFGTRTGGVVGAGVAIVCLNVVAIALFTHRRPGLEIIGT